jgi:hypothetical protein
VFEAALEATFKAIFEVKKVTYNEISDSQEQGCIFIEVENSRNTIKDGRQRALVTGNALMFGPYEKMPFGFFSKKIAKADPALTKPFFFFDFETNTRRYGDIVQRGFGFVFLYDAQYDPAIGEISSLEFTEEQA